MARKPPPPKSAKPPPREPPAPPPEGERRKERREEVRTFISLSSLLVAMLGMLGKNAVPTPPATPLPAQPSPVATRVVAARPPPGASPAPVPPLDLTEAQKLEREKMKAELYAARPTFVFDYVIASSDRIAGNTEEFVRYAGTLLQNEILADFNALPETPLVAERIAWPQILRSPDLLRQRLGKDQVGGAEREIICLRVAPKGHRRAVGVKVYLAHYQSEKAFELDEEANLSVVAWIGARAQKLPAEMVVPISDSSESSAILIPLIAVEQLETDSKVPLKAGEPRRWRLVRGQFLRPIRIEYRDPIEEQPRREDIRSMFPYATKAERGIRTRG